MTITLMLDELIAMLSASYFSGRRDSTIPSEDIDDDIGEALIMKEFEKQVHGSEWD